jgi:thiol:disulfide interchange protein DsbD
LPENGSISLVRPKSVEAFKDDYILISLYVDDKTTLPDTAQYVSSFSGKKIKSLGNKYSDIQASQYGTNSQPYYVLLDPHKPEDATDRLLNKPRAFDQDIEAYTDFLTKGLEEYQRRNSK